MIASANASGPLRKQIRVAGAVLSKRMRLRLAKANGTPEAMPTSMARAAFGFQPCAVKEASYQLISRWLEVSSKPRFEGSHGKSTTSAPWDSQQLRDAARRGRPRPSAPSR